MRNELRTLTSVTPHAHQNPYRQICTKTLIFFKVNLSKQVVHPGVMASADRVLGNAASFRQAQVPSRNGET